MSAGPCPYTQFLNQHQASYVKRSDVLGYLQKKFPDVNVSDFELENVAYRWRFKTPRELPQDEIDKWVNELREVARQDNLQGDDYDDKSGGGGIW